MRRIGILFLTTAILFVFCTNNLCMAHENDYSPTSSLNQGWQQGIEGGIEVAHAIFGDKPEIVGMTAEIGDDSSEITVKNYLEKQGWVITPNKGNNARYINVDIDDSIAHSVTDGQSYAVAVEYYDEGRSSLTIEYDSMKYQPIIRQEAGEMNANTPLNASVNAGEREYIIFNDTKVWRNYQWFLPNPRFANELDGYDFRVGIYSKSMGYSRGGEVTISAIRLYRLDTVSRINITADTEKHIGNIFFQGEEIELSANIDNTIYPVHSQADGGYDLDIEWTIRDEYGTLIDTAEDTVSVEPLDKQKVTHKFKVDKYGIYRVDIEARDTEKKLYSHCGTEFSYVRHESDDFVNKHMGIQIALTNPEDERIVELTRKIGIRNVRMMLYYNNFRRSANNYEPTGVGIPMAFKSLFRAFKNNGMEIDINIHSASWMGAQYAFSETERTPPYTKEGLRRWADYCRMVADMFGDTADQFEIWNEYNLGPNHSFNLSNRPASDYAKLYEVSKAAIRDVNPNIPVIGLNTSGAPIEWISEVLDTGIGKNMDILSIHPYQWDGDPLTYSVRDRNLVKIKELMKKYGLEDKPIWITEYGYSSNYEDVNSYLEQGAYIAQAYPLILSTGIVDRYYHYCLLDKNTNIRADRESNFGIMRDRLTYPLPYMVPYGAKPAYLMVSQMNHMYADSEYIDEIKLNDTSIILRFKNKKTGKQFGVMYSNRENGQLATLKLGTDKLTLYDSYGNAEEISGVKGVYSFDLNKRVQYIEGDFTSFECTEGGVYPEQIAISVTYGKDADIKIKNYSGKPVTVSADALEGSEVRIKGSGTINSQEGKLTISAGKAVSGTERVRLLITGENKVWYNGYIYLTYQEPVQLESALNAVSDGWEMRCSITNAGNDIVKGRLTLISPNEWHKKVPDTKVTLLPNETKELKLRLPVGLTADETQVETAFVVDEESGLGSYISKSYNFAAAQKATSPIVIDGKGNEWTDGFMTLNRNDQFKSLLSLGSTYAGPDDLSCQAAVKWDKDNLYFYADVTDNIHFASGCTPVNCWSMDSIQLALVYDPEDKLAKSEFEEFAMCLLDDKPTIYRHKTTFTGDGDYTSISDSELAIVREGLHTYYELRAPWKSLMPELQEIQPGTELKFSMVINENDGVGRVGYMTYGEGIVGTKDSTKFKRLYIRE